MAVDLARSTCPRRRPPTPGLRERDGQGQPDVAEPDDADRAAGAGLSCRCFCHRAPTLALGARPVGAAGGRPWHPCRHARTRPRRRRAAQLHQGRARHRRPARRRRRRSGSSTPASTTTAPCPTSSSRSWTCREPDLNLGVGSGSHAAPDRGAARGRSRRPSWPSRRDRVVVYGDVNSTLAAALVCAKLLIPVAHVEAGLRSFDPTMPEEVNRRVTDLLSRPALRDRPGGRGQPGRARASTGERVIFVGNPMIDTLLAHLDRLQPGPVMARLGLAGPVCGGHAAPAGQRGHARGRGRARGRAARGARAAAHRPAAPSPGPRHAGRGRPARRAGPAASSTRSATSTSCRSCAVPRSWSPTRGGIQEETTVLDVPCLTLRPNTERPITHHRTARTGWSAGATGAGRWTPRCAVRWQRPGDGPPRLGRSRRRAHRGACSSSGLATAMQTRRASARARGRSPLRAILLPSYRLEPLPATARGRASTKQGVEAAVGSRVAGSDRHILGAWLAHGRPDVRPPPLDPRVPGRQPRAGPPRATCSGSTGSCASCKARGVRHRLDRAQPEGPRGRRRRHRARSAAHRALIERARRGHPATAQRARRGAHRAVSTRRAAQARMHVVPHGSYVGQYAVDADAAAARRRWACRRRGTVFAFVGAIRGYKGVGELRGGLQPRRAELGPDARLLICGKPLPARHRARAGASAPRPTRASSCAWSASRRRSSRGCCARRTWWCCPSATSSPPAVPSWRSATAGPSSRRRWAACRRRCRPMPRFLYDPDDPDALAGALHRAAGADLAAMGGRARAWADGLDWGPIAAETARLYRGD